MKLKTITLIAAIAQLASALCGIYNFISVFKNVGWSGDIQFLITQPVYWIADTTLAVFLFALVARQKN